MHWRLASVAFVLLTVGLGAGTAAMFANGRVGPVVLGAVATAGLVACGAWAARGQRLFTFSVPRGLGNPSRP